MSGKNRSVAVAFVMLLASNGAAACGTGRVETAQDVKLSEPKKAPAATPTPVRAGEESMNQSDIKVLAEGLHGRVSEAFVAVARDRETYDALRTLVSGLPEMSADFFKSNAVIAAFLGTRNTGGYTVSVTHTANGPWRVSESVPPKDAILIQVITEPFKVVSVPVGDQAMLMLELGESLKTRMRPYRVASGEFEFGGGFAGRTEKFQLEGDIRAAARGKLVTLVFALRGAGGTEERSLQTVASGLTEGNKTFRVTRLDAGSLVDWPNGGLSATGQFTENENKLSLSFTPLPSNFSDGYSGGGKLEANATAPPPQKPKSPLVDQ